MVRVSRSLPAIRRSIQVSDVGVSLVGKNFWISNVKAFIKVKEFSVLVFSVSGSILKSPDFNIFLFVEGFSSCTIFSKNLLTAYEWNGDLLLLRFFSIGSKTSVRSVSSLLSVSSSIAPKPNVSSPLVTFCTRLKTFHITAWLLMLIQFLQNNFQFGSLKTFWQHNYGECLQDFAYYGLSLCRVPL